MVPSKGLKLPSTVITVFHYKTPNNVSIPGKPQYIQHNEINVLCIKNLTNLILNGKKKSKSRMHLIEKAYLSLFWKSFAREWKQYFDVKLISLTYYAEISLHIELTESMQWSYSQIIKMGRSIEYCRNYWDFFTFFASGSVNWTRSIPWILSVHTEFSNLSIKACHSIILELWETPLCIIIYLVNVRMCREISNTQMAEKWV